MYLILLLFSIVIQFDFSYSNRVENYQFRIGRTENLDKLLNKIIENVQTNAKDIGINPMKLPNINKTIDEGWIKTFFQSISLSNGDLSNLAILQQYGESTISYDDKELNVKLGLTFIDLEVNYDFNAVGSYWIFSQKGSLKGSVKDLNIIVDASVNLDTLKAVVNDIQFPETGSIDIKFDSFTITAWVLNGILDIATTFFKNTILEDVQEALIKSINDLLKNIPGN